MEVSLKSDFAIITDRKAPSRRVFEEYIGKPENLKILESLVLKFSKKYRDLLNRKENLDYGTNLIESGEVTGTTNQAKKIVHEILGISGKNIPDYDLKYIDANAKNSTESLLLVPAMLSLPMSELLPLGEYNDAVGVVVSVAAIIAFSVRELLRSSHYNTVNQNLVVGEPNKYLAMIHFAHEYVHHIQHSTPELRSIATNSIRKNPLFEGQARLVEMMVSQKISKINPNSAAELDCLERLAPELKDAYLYTCRKKGLTPNPEIEGNFIKDLSKALGHRGRAHHYTLGSGAFQIAAARYGAQTIARNVLANDFSFMRD